MMFRRKDIAKIQEVLDKFPDILFFEIHESEQTGIGSIITMTIHTQIEGTQGKFTIDINSVEDW